MLREEHKRRLFEERVLNQDAEKCVTISFVICTFARYYYVEISKEDKRCVSCCQRGKKKQKCIKIFGIKNGRKYPLWT
jgi:hypothetical protein